MFVAYDLYLEKADNEAAEMEIVRCKLFKISTNRSQSMIPSITVSQAALDDSDSIASVSSTASSSAYF